MKAELLRTYVDILGREPEVFNMQVGIQRQPQSFLSKLRREPCGTACCLAGRVYLDTDAHHIPGMLAATEPGKELDWKKIRARAAETLGLTDEQAKKLFFVKNWPERFAVQYIRALDGLGRIEALRNAVEDFIATDGWAPSVRLSIQNGELVEHAV
jgi:hypothetical protein